MLTGLQGIDYECPGDEQFVLRLPFPFISTCRRGYLMGDSFCKQDWLSAASVLV